MSLNDFSAVSIDFQISSDSALSDVRRSFSFDFRHSSSSRMLFWISVSVWNKGGDEGLIKVLQAFKY